ncbi:NHL repeat-containing protein [Patulibacter americanus]|uniref:NHL repeat-containing protein n=1 Tax=Patulibacter americanus TaxID=588672 RepID=UPI0003B36C33|nr:NHL repeat-containing protein [Patulibacter americanus]
MIRSTRPAPAGRRSARRAPALLGLAVAVAGVAGAAVPSGAAAAEYTAVRAWEVKAGQGLAVGAKGDVYVAVSPSGADGVVRYSSTGRQTARWGTPGRDAGQIDSPFGIAVDGAENVYVTDIAARVSVFSGSGELRAASPLSGPGGATVIGNDIDVDRAGERWIAHNGRGSLANGVLRFGSDGTGLASFGGQGGGDGQFTTPGGVASDGRGNVYVSDVRNHRIQRFTADGTFVRGWGQAGSGRTQLREPRGIAVDARGDVFVADHGNHRIQHYRPDGTHVTSIPLPDVDPYEAAPWDLDVDRAGNLYVLQRKNAAIGAVNVLRPVTGAVVRSSRLRVSSGRIPVELRCADRRACRGTVSVRRGGTVVASGAFRVSARRSATVRVRTTARGRTVLRRASSHEVQVRVKPARGRAVSTPLILR